MLDALLGLVSSKWLFAAPLMLVLLGVLIRRFSRSGIYVWLFLVLAIGLGDGIGNILKHVLEVPRPCQALAADVRLVTEPLNYKCSSKPHGMPSNHTLNYFLLAVVFSMLMNSWRWGLGLSVLALTVGVSRIYLGMHFPSQVFAGALLGSGLGFVFALIFIRTAWFRRMRFMTQPTG